MINTKEVSEKCKSEYLGIIRTVKPVIMKETNKKAVGLQHQFQKKIAYIIPIKNVSNDPTPELYEEYNKLFKTYWKSKIGQEVTHESLDSHSIRM